MNIHGKYIVVDDRRYRLCKDVMIFNNRNILIAPENIDGATEVKLFENKRMCEKNKGTEICAIGGNHE